MYNSFSQFLFHLFTNQSQIQFYKLNEITTAMTVVLLFSYCCCHSSHLLTDLNQPWLGRGNLKFFLQLLSTTKVILWTTVGGLWMELSGLYVSQSITKELYNGHKRVHALKFQSVVAANGMIANLFGPVEGRKHESRMLAMSGLLDLFKRHSFSPDGQALNI